MSRRTTASVSSSFSGSATAFATIGPIRASQAAVKTLTRNIDAAAVPPGLTSQFVGDMLLDGKGPLSRRIVQSKVGAVVAKYRRASGAIAALTAARFASYAASARRRRLNAARGGNDRRPSARRSDRRGRRSNGHSPTFAVEAVHVRLALHVDHDVGDLIGSLAEDDDNL